MTSVSRMEQLNRAVHAVLAREETAATIARLKEEIARTDEPFVWSVIDIAALVDLLPSDIRSGWFFVLKKDVPSGAHHHPNSVQHLVLLEGEGASVIDGVERALEPRGWAIIPKHVAHEFFPRGRDMVVMSFHTCLAEELEEVAVGGGVSRHYVK